MVYYDPQYTLEDMQTRVRQALNDLLSLAPIGGRTYYTTAEAQNILSFGDIIDALESVPGVRTTHA